MRRRSIFIAGALLVVAGLVGLGFWQRHDWWVWLKASQYSNMPAEERQAVLADLRAGEARLLPLVIRQLRSEDATCCAGTGQMLRELLGTVPNSLRAEAVLRELAAEFASFSPPGQQQALELWVELFPRLDDPVPAELQPTAALLLEQSARAGDGCRKPALELALLLLPSAAGDQVRVHAKYLAEQALRSGTTQEQRLAVKLAAYPVLGLLDQLPRLLSAQEGAAPEVRSLVLLALGSHEQLLPSEQIVPLLHAEPAELAQLADQVLRSRGLTEAQLRLARLLANPDGAERARVVPLLLEGSAVDAQVWLERLTKDPSPAVRAAVIRVAMGKGDPQWRERVREMAQSDPNSTVQAIARFHLSSQQPGENSR